MKKYIPTIIFASFVVALGWSCVKSNPTVASTSSTNSYAFIKVSDFSPNFRGIVGNRDSFNIYVNNVKLTGAFLSYGLTYPTASNLYAAVPAGTVSIKLSAIGVNGLAGTFGADSTVVATITKTLTAGGYYSFIMTDSLLTATDSKQIFVQDNFTRTDTTHFTVRFAHTILADTAGKNVDVYSNRLGANMFSNISPGTVTTFTSQPYNIITDTLIVRRAGTSFELARLTTASIPFARERAYTVIYKGTAALTTGAKARSLISYPNQ